MKINNILIEWLGHSSFKIKSNKIIYIDPFKINQDEKADLIIVTHEHFDHYSKEDIKKISDEHTKIITWKNFPPKSKTDFEGITIESTFAYNINKFRSPNVVYHPKEKGFIGIILTINNTKIYHAGDTDFIPEMNFEVDVALLPVSGTYVMTAEEAVKAANAINAKAVIPMHYGTIVGNKKDAEKFSRLFKGKTEFK